MEYTFEIIEIEDDEFVIVQITSPGQYCQHRFLVSREKCLAEIVGKLSSTKE